MLSKVFFSDYFGVDRAAINAYGAIDISLVNDTPLFIDPFLIFESDKDEYKALHNGIVDYLHFLQARQFSGSSGEFSRLLHFGEVKQTWLGYSLSGNAGQGLGRKFADALSKRIHLIVPSDDCSDSMIETGVHLEKLCLLDKGIGNDKVSDFTANLIKLFLAEYTSQFAVEHIDPQLLREVPVEKAVFDYETKRWKPKKILLPYHAETRDYVLLTPRDILTKNDLWINNTAFYEEFCDLPSRVSNEQLREEINAYLQSLIPRGGGGNKKPTKGELYDIYGRVALKYPILIDAFIASREENGERATEQSAQEVDSVEQVFSYGARDTISQLGKDTLFFATPRLSNSFDEAMDKVGILKYQIENNDLYRVFYHNGEVIINENGLQRFFKLIWAASRSAFDINPETNHGKGPVDFAVSFGAADKTLIEFKMASNRQLESNLANQLSVYARADVASREVTQLTVIFFFTEREYNRATAILHKLKLDQSENIVLIDARADNKPSGSKVK